MTCHTKCHVIKESTVMGSSTFLITSPKYFNNGHKLYGKLNGRRKTKDVRELLAYVRAQSSQIWVSLNTSVSFV